MKEYNSFEGKISVKIGDVFDVSLESQAGSTGYSWALSSMPNCLYLLEISHVTSSSSIIGSKSSQTFRFAAVAEADACLEFSLCRPWEPLKPVEKKVYHINITAQGIKLEEELKGTMGNSIFLSSNVVNPKTVCEQSPIIPYGVPLSVMEDADNCLLKYGVPTGIAANSTDCILKYGAPVSILEDADNCLLKYGIPTGKAVNEEECVLKYGAPVHMSTIRPLYGVQSMPNVNTSAYPIYKSASSDDIVVVYGIPNVKYGVAAAAVRGENACYTPYTIVEDAENCVVKYGIPTGVAANEENCLLKYGAPVLKTEN